MSKSTTTETQTIHYAGFAFGLDFFSACGRQMHQTTDGWTLADQKDGYALLSFDKALVTCDACRANMALSYEDRVARLAGEESRCPGCNVLVKRPGYCASCKAEEQDFRH